jgi:hypothetical protein
MNENDLVEFYIEVKTTDATEDELDGMARQLLSELRGTDVDSAELTSSGASPGGTKSAAGLTIGSILSSK